jgi:aminoglycoside 6'-N-acetyltransferase
VGVFGLERRVMGAVDIRLRHASQADAPLLVSLSEQPHVIAATSDDPLDEPPRDEGYWLQELAGCIPGVSEYWIAEREDAGGEWRPIGVMQMVDPHVEPTHYWGETEPNLRALDIWIGDANDLGKGYGEVMMRQACARCFDDPAVIAVIVDPLASNTRAQKFYERLGFRRTHSQTFDDHTECQIMRLSRADWREIG